METIHTSESLKSQVGEFEKFHYQLEDGEKYKLTSGESDWLFKFINGRYSIADHLIDNIEETEDGESIYTVDCIGMGKALSDDQTFPKAVMLSDDTALQAIFFHSSYSDDS